MKLSKELVEQKKLAKKKKPNFVRQESHRRKRLGTKWRKPKGIHSKLRLHRRGKPSMVSIGYKTPVALQNRDSEGRLPFIVHNLKELKLFNPKENYAILYGKLGNKKRLQILEEAKKLKISFSNIKIDEKIKQIKQKAESKKELKKKREERKKKKEAERKKKEKGAIEKAKAQEKEKKKTEKMEKAKKKSDLAKENKKTKESTKKTEEVKK